MTYLFSQAGFVAGFIIFAVLSLCIVTIWRRRYDAVSLILVTIATTLWCVLLALESLSGFVLPLPVFIAELLVDIAWLNFLGALLQGAIAVRGFQLVRYGGVLLGGIVLLAGLFVAISSASAEQVLMRVMVAGSVLTSVAGLILVEQVIRNSRPAHRRSLRYVCLAAGIVMLFDLVLYAEAILLGQINPLLWGLRGYVIVISGLLLLRAVVLRKSGGHGIFVSRHVAFHTATIVIAGIILIFAGLIAQLVRSFGLPWGKAAELVLFAVAIVLILVLFLSDRYRNRLRVLISKHFFDSKYDYREEWRRLNHTLTSPELELTLNKRSIRAMLELLDADAGILWMFDEKQTLYAVSSWNCPVPSEVITAEHPLLRFIEARRWVIDLQELANGSGQYSGIANSEPVFGEQDLLVPLQHDDSVCGVISLAGPKLSGRLNYEDYDLLKIVGQQIASYLRQEQTATRLTESMQFEAFNKLTTYLMHDLKNTMAQQQLIVDNAKKHRHNPDFIDDAIETIRLSTARIRRVVEQLQQATQEQRFDRIDVLKLVMVAATQSEQRHPVPTTRLNADQAVVLGDEAQLLMVICHAISNAQDATEESGEIVVELEAIDGDCCIRIVDNGQGMEPDFIRDRLFKPFDSTKGAQGMGIGAYQIRETIRSMGGEVEVKSTVGKGTCLELRIPLAD